MKNFPITLSVLTWKAPLTLEKTLRSLEPILPLFSERLVICQESDLAEIKLADQFGFRAVATEKNSGIQNGLKLAVSAATNDLVLVLENDANYVGGSSNFSELCEVLDKMMSMPIDHIRLGQLENPPSKRFYKFWRNQMPPARRFIGYLRWNLANTRKYEALALPKIRTTASLSGFKKLSDSFWVTTSKYTTWTNRSFLTRKKFFLDQLVPFAEEHPTSRLINGYPDLEHPINCSKNRNWWRAQNFSIGISVPGIFGHSRYDRNEMDEKGQQDPQL